MLSEANALEIRIRMEALICEREGMIAENAQRQYTGYAVAYGPDVFFNLENRFDELADTLVRSMEG